MLLGRDGFNGKSDGGPNDAEREEKIDEECNQRRSRLFQDQISLVPKHFVIAHIDDIRREGECRHLPQPENLCLDVRLQERPRCFL